MTVDRSDVIRVLREEFGFTTFRPGQERVIRDVLAGRDALAILSTGAGKSLTYQLTAQLLPGPTVVVSPLIALMQDQIDAMAARGLAASVINSTLSDAEAERELAKLRSGEARLLYVTPERLANDQFVALMRSFTISLFVVDEAHCISEWGHSFRPAYLNLRAAAEQLGRPTILALTATATPWVRRDIVERLGMRDPDVVVRGIDRPNLFFEVVRVETAMAEQQTLVELLRGGGRRYPPELSEQLAEAMRGSGIIYTATTKQARATAELLQENGIAADYYHGQRRKSDRERVQGAFMAGDLQVISATKAFGMGVDKPDVRFVIHQDVPGSVEEYYQEAGRAGRDGGFARCTIIYRPADLGLAAFLAGSGQLTVDDVAKGRAALVDLPSTTRRELAASSGLSLVDVARLIDVLQRHGLVEERRGRLRLRATDFDPAAVSLSSEERRHAYERSQLEMMARYVDLAECRRRYILNYFGEEDEGESCGRCDNDVPAADERRVTIAEPESVSVPFGLGDVVEHAAWGRGVVEQVQDASITVLFDSVGYRTLDAAVVQERGLLEPARPSSRAT